MDKHVWKTVAVVLALTAPTWAAGTVSFELTSPSHGSWVPIGGSVDWTIIVTVSSGDNLGLALVSIDLLQDPANPMLFDLPPADGIPDEMSCFDRSAGIANPVPEGFVSGYRGTPIGTAGQRNLVQIGGAQNTFGAEAGGIGLDVDVDSGIGQSLGGQIVATGSFPAPSALGAYTFSIASPLANVLDAVNPAPDFSPVSAATTEIVAGAISFNVCRGGDASGDAQLTQADLAPFVSYLLGETPLDDYARCACDLNVDGAVDGGDIQPFVEALLAS